AHRRVGILVVALGAQPDAQPAHRARHVWRAGARRERHRAEGLMRVLLFLLLLTAAAYGQGAAVNTQCFNPSGTGANQWQGCPTGFATSTNSSSTITSGGTYQSIWAANAKRNACTVQNNGSHVMYVFFGPIASASHNTSVQIAVGQSVQCGSGGIVLTDQ